MQIQSHNKNVTLQQIIRAVAEATKTLPREITGAGQHKYQVNARYAVMLMGRFNGFPSPFIARELGNRDHSTVVQGQKRAVLEIRACTPRGVAIANNVDRATRDLGLVPVNWEHALGNIKPQPSKVKAAPEKPKTEPVNVGREPLAYIPEKIARRAGMKTGGIAKDGALICDP